MTDAISQKTADRFWKKVDQNGDCWIWTAGKRGGGYGSFWFDGAKRYAHRVSWLLSTGAWPVNDLDHICRNHACVRPSHLRDVTNKQNGENRSVESHRSSSGFRGVTWDRNRRKWRVQVMHNGRQYRAGHFATVPEAVAAVQEERRRLHRYNDQDRNVTYPHPSQSYQQGETS